MAPGPDPLGKRALFWMSVDGDGEPGDTPVGSRPGKGAPRSRPPGRHALFSAAVPADRGAPSGLFQVSCSSCGSTSRVGLLGLLRCQLPVPVWLPRPVFDRWMTCPVCRRRTWASVTLAR